METKEVKAWWNQLKEDGELVDFVETKFEGYRNDGWDVGLFRSLSTVGYENKTITLNRGPYHELKTIHEMDEFLKEHNKDDSNDS